MPRGCYEPWGLFRKPLGTMTVSDCLRRYQTGGLRRYPDGPFEDVIPSERTPQREREIANHPSIKPQSFLRRLVHAALPLGEGLVADPFMGSGSTIAACEAIGVRSIGVERHREYFELAKRAIPRLEALETDADELVKVGSPDVPGHDNGSILTGLGRPSGNRSRTACPSGRSKNSPLM